MFLALVCQTFTSTAFTLETRIRNVTLYKICGFYSAKDSSVLKVSAVRSARLSNDVTQKATV
jgi:hypothetical protein